MADRSLLYGQWGDERQCRRLLISSTGTVYAAPFEIRPDWLAHGEVWCRLTWISTGSSSAGVYALARGLCGEDSVRDYRVRFDLRGDQLILLWDEQLKNGPLQRCSMFLNK